MDSDRTMFVFVGTDSDKSRGYTTTLPTEIDEIYHVAVTTLLPPMAIM